MPSAQKPRVLTRELPSTLTAYHDYVQEVLSGLQELDWPQEELFGVHMALEESISNAVRHGNGEDPKKVVRVECHLDDKRFFAKVCDEGPGYQPEEVPDCCSPDRLEVPGGRGLKLIRAYMDTVEHADCGRCLKMEKLLT